MRRVYAVLLALCLALAGALATAGPAQAAAVTITNGTQFTDTIGSPVHAHGGGVIKVGAYYYWFGENRNADNTFRYVAAYRSTDLKNWEFRNHVLTQSSAPPSSPVANIERPKVIYNASTGKYVMWMHKENGADYSEARAAVAVSDTVDGNYTWQGSFRPLGHAHVPGHHGVRGRRRHRLHDLRRPRELRPARSTGSPPTTPASPRLVADLWHGGHREAPALFKRNGVYFMLTSGATGWSPNQQQYATATSITGPWSAHGERRRLARRTARRPRTSCPSRAVRAPRTSTWATAGATPSAGPSTTPGTSGCR